MSAKKASRRYTKIIEWSEEDNCYVGRCPEVMSGGIHGADEIRVYHELCKAVDEWVRLDAKRRRTRAPHRAMR